MDNLKHIPLALLGLFILKLLARGCSASEAAVVFALTALISVNEMMSRSKKIQEVEQTCDSEINKIKDVVNKQNELLTKMAEELAKNKTSVESMKLANGLRAAK